MREIKFRAWDYTNKEMVLGVGITPESDLQVPYKINSTSDDPENHSYYPDSVLMQFTNLRDKNGVEIYEGDIVHLSNDEGIDYNALIVFYNGGFCAIDGEEGNHSVRRYGLMRSELDIVIIGNRFENLELLEGEEDAASR